MFGWILRRFRSKRVARLRAVFHYLDDKRERSADPLEIERAIVLLMGEDWRDKLASLSKPITPGVIGEDASNMREDREKLRSQFLYAIDTAFDVQGYRDGVGMTESERLGLLAGYNKYLLNLIVEARNFRNARPRESPSPVS